MYFRIPYLLLQNCNPSMPLGCNVLLSYAITSDIDGQENCMS
jgi:hypothetical protein